MIDLTIDCIPIFDPSLYPLSIILFCLLAFAILHIDTYRIMLSMNILHVCYNKYNYLYVFCVCQSYLMCT